MSRLPLFYLIAATFCLLAGVCLGIGMGIAHDFQLAPVHAHLNLLGWTSLALMGLVFRAWPELCASVMPSVIQFCLMVGAALLFPAGIWLSITQGEPGLAIGASLAWLAGVGLFLARLLRLAFRPAPRRLPAFLPAE
ncbi:hypothetical protein [Falsiroseomonas selenitidurans]|uniref:Cytochrome-c oxidase n=1 Tax=Falsiroseomonas selenitidurans TaxID=2716335 RepID=A0ABX1DYG2_9PROT|nr:hypothetical protein [Falsiroseomonas selenitidurans]NKC29415.1 hypothetical protein [Falsiroseomonas selenitidurans]